MRPLRSWRLLALLATLGACGGESTEQGAPPPASSGEPGAGRGPDAGGDEGSPFDAGPASDATREGSTLDAGDAGGCAVSGAPGLCMAVESCMALPDHSSFPGYCPGSADVECCMVTPNTADNPPVPAGYRLMPQSQVTPAMTTWAVAILDDPATYPMFQTATQIFGTLMVLARVEWHPPDFQNGAVHRGVTLYVPL